MDRNLLAFHLGHCAVQGLLAFWVVGWAVAGSAIGIIQAAVARWTQSRSSTGAGVGKEERD